MQALLVFYITCAGKCVVCHWIINKCHIVSNPIIVKRKWLDKRHCTFKGGHFNMYNIMPAMEQYSVETICAMLIVYGLIMAFEQFRS